MFEGLNNLKPVKEKFKDVQSVQRTFKTLKCKVCEGKFRDKDESKEHWTLTEIVCKTCQQCCVGASTGTGIFPPKQS